MRVELPETLLLEAKYDLYGCWASRSLVRLADHGAGRVLEYVSNDAILANFGFGNTTLIAPHELKHAERALVDFSATIAYDTNYDLS